MSSGEVSVVQTACYERQTLVHDIKLHLDRLKLYEKITPKTKVVLKPNLLMKRTPDLFTTTHPQMVYAVATYLQNLGVVDITLCDSPGGPYTKSALQGIYDSSGMSQVASELGIKLNFDLTSAQVAFPQGETCKGFEIISPLLEKDVFIIDICKVKTHMMTTLSGAVKNMFGSIPGLLKPRMHYRFPDVGDFSSMLTDLCACVHPDLVVVDGVQAMMGDGPSSGVLCEMGYTLAGYSAFDVDVCLCKLMGLDPQAVPMVKNALDRGLTSQDICVLGAPLTAVPGFVLPKSGSVDFLSGLPKPLQKIGKAVMGTLFTPKPKIHTKACVGCGKCAESCPPSIIKIVDKKAIINYKNCQKCYCCHEMCPVGAISVSKNFLTKR